MSENSKTEFIINAIDTCILSIMLLIGIRFIIIDSNKFKKIDLPFQIIYLVSVITYYIFIIIILATTITYLYYLQTNKLVYLNWFYFFLQIDRFIYGLIPLITLVSLSFRLKFVFKNTKYKMSKLFIIINRIILLSGIVLYFIASSMRIITQNMNNSLIIENLALIFIIIIGIIYILYSIFILVTFVKKILTIQKNIDSTNNEKLLKVANKYIILGSIQYLATFMFVLPNVIYTFVDNLLISILSVELWYLDVFVSALCIYLQYNFAQNDFNRLSGCINKSCVRGNQEHIEQHIQESEMDSKFTKTEI